MLQRQLHNAHVMVVGCGALGNEVMKNLVLMGVGHLVIVDFDVVEMGNLTRSVLYRKSDVGLPKVEVARKALLELSPELDIRCINGDIAYDVGLNTIRQMDVIIGCVDSRWARYCIQRLCLRVGKTWVDGGILNLEGTARVFTPGCTCYACSLGDEGLRELHRRMPCSGIIRRQEQAGHAPTTPIIASVIGAVEAQEAIKIITNTHRPSPNTQHAEKMFYYEGESLTVQTHLFDAWDDDCALHDEWQLDGLEEIPELMDMPLEMLFEKYLPSGEILLNEPFVDKIVDRKTDECFQVMLPAHKVECFFCSHPLLRTRLLGDFYQHEYTEITSSFPYTNLSLRQIGVPEDDILRVRTEDGIRYVVRINNHISAKK